jgi:hypothetical protein
MEGGSNLPEEKGFYRRLFWGSSFWEARSASATHPDPDPVSKLEAATASLSKFGIIVVIFQDCF